MRVTELDRKWQELMTLCAKEKELLASRSHPRLLKLLSREIDRAAAALGFGPVQIEKREFRAERERGHIVRIIAPD
jgi:hypothetical protein